MTLDGFEALSPVKQARHVRACGTYLARRWDGNVFVHLYHVPGPFFVELHCRFMAKEIYQIRAFASAGPLAAYAAAVRLPSDW